ILKTLDLKTIEPSIFFENPEELKALYDTKQKGKSGEFKKLNVCLLILESFSKEYIGAINGRTDTYTPFLDSLITQSLTFNNAYSNGKKSIEGIPAITSSIPSWMTEAYISSPYGSNTINSLASLLNEQGYNSSFFHGGTNGTMGFNAFASLSGYQKYYGRKEYNNEKDYDGNWGIWDEEFLQYTANTINVMPTPFFTTIFTLTSHHPFAIPDKYKSRFPEGHLPIHKSIRYSDYALKRFFESAKKMPWFNNTLFVLCADHTGISTDFFYSTQMGNHCIPIIYYMPGSNLQGINPQTTQQLDIMPSILDYMNYPKDYFAFGKSVFDSTDISCLTFNSSFFQLMDSTYVLQFDGTNSINLYNFKKDSLFHHNLINVEPKVLEKMEKQTKAMIQTYQQSLINNTMIIK
ncbi:MAG: LTA synthase family protein, partial [Bacteroidia bacterium]|nr:LTA synthase family protein [Bacteroidia bacterium]